MLILFVFLILVVGSGWPVGATYETSGTGISTSAAKSAPKVALGIRSTAKGIAAVPARPQTPTGPPSSPTLVAPFPNGTIGTTTSPTLAVSVADPANSNLTVTFYGRVANTVGRAFTIVALPDTQFYSSAENGGTPAMFNTQTTWVANQQSSLNIDYVAHLGDIIQSADNNGDSTEWTRADAALKILEAAGIPYGVHPGNHDEGKNASDTGDTAVTDAYNTWFGVSRYSGRPYYGGHYSTTNDNHYDLFSAGGMDFITIYFAYDTSTTGPRFQGVLAWANGVLKQYSNRHAILVSHYIINSGNPATFGAQGQALFNALSSNPNVFLMLSGHVNPNGEGQRTDTVNGNAIQSVMSDFQNLTNGGNGWLRVMTFLPASNQIQVQTYSPVLNQYMTDSASQFTLPWNMQNSGYTNLGTVSNVASGSQATLGWNNLTAGTRYEWYAVVSNGTYATTGATWNFTPMTSSAPAITSASGTTFTAGTAGTFTVTATGAPTPSLSESGLLPSGVMFKDNGNGTATLSGTPASGSNATYSLTLTATNGIATPATQTFLLSIHPAPVAAPVAFVRAAGNVGESTRYTVKIAPKAGDFLAVFVWQNEGAATPSSVTDNRGSGYTRDCDMTYNQGVGNRRLTVYHLLNAPSGITAVSITPNHSSQAIVAEYSGMPTTGAVLDACGTVNNQTHSVRSWSSAVTVTKSTDLIFGLADTRAVAVAGYAASGAWKARLTQHDYTVADDDFVEDQIGVAAGSYTATGTTTASVTESAVVVAFKTGH